MKLRNIFYLLFILPFLFIQTACSSDDESNPTNPTVNEAQVLAEYLEANGDFLNTSAPAMITSQDVRDMQLAKPDKIYIMDIRSSSDYQNKGHIAGAVNVTLKDIVTHVKVLVPLLTRRLLLHATQDKQPAWQQHS